MSNKCYDSMTYEEKIIYLGERFTRPQPRARDETIAITKRQFEDPDARSFQNRLRTAAATAGLHLATIGVDASSLNLKDISLRTGIDMPDGDMVSAAALLGAAQAIMKLCEEMNGEDTSQLPGNDVSKTVSQIMNLASEIGPGISAAIRAKYMRRDGIVPPGEVINILDDGEAVIVTKEGLN